MRDQSVPASPNLRARRTIISNGPTNQKLVMLDPVTRVLDGHQTQLSSLRTSNTVITAL